MIEVVLLSQNSSARQLYSGMQCVNCMWTLASTLSKSINHLQACHKTFQCNSHTLAAAYLLIAFLSWEHQVMNTRILCSSRLIVSLCFDTKCGEAIELVLKVEKERNFEEWFHLLKIWYHSVWWWLQSEVENFFI